MSQPEDDDYEHQTRYKNYFHTGRAFVFSNMYFGDEHDYRYVKEENRKVERVLKKSGFNVTRYLDRTIDQIRHLIKEAAAKEDFSEYSCFLAVFSSHGNWTEFQPKAAGDWTGQKGRYYADVIFDKENNTITVGELAAFLKPVSARGSANESLNGKPKLFLIQSCRGENSEVSLHVPVEKDSGQVLGAANLEKQHMLEQKEDFLTAGIPYHIPIWKDFFFHFCTVPGYVAWREDTSLEDESEVDESPFLQAWCDVLTNADLKMTHFRDLATFVNGHVVDNYPSLDDEEPDYSNHKMMPQIVSMMSKDFYLKRD